MDRIMQLQSALLREIDRYALLVQDRDQPLDWERVHMASSARLAWILAEERGLDPELCACACSVHDYGRILTGRQEGHAEAGYEPVKLFLRRLHLFAPGEIEQIAVAVKNHSRKSYVDAPMDEVIKDADVLDCTWYGIPFSREEHRMRYEAYVSSRSHGR
ncbi:MAG: HD domain-containing protein [Oscillospiraceae bacterium]|jgi:uncharacterized protein